MSPTSLSKQVKSTTRTLRTRARPSQSQPQPQPQPTQVKKVRATSSGIGGTRNKNKQQPNKRVPAMDRVHGTSSRNVERGYVIPKKNVTERSSLPTSSTGSREVKRGVFDDSRYTSMGRNSSRPKRHRVPPVQQPHISSTSTIGIFPEEYRTLPPANAGTLRRTEGTVSNNVVNEPVYDSSESSGSYEPSTPSSTPPQSPPAEPDVPPGVHRNIRLPW